jgi:hypothetical protein
MLAEHDGRWTNGLMLSGFPGLLTATLFRRKA